ncbi:MAG: hypothetical protein AB1798_15015 [Spirochaetota bacterium]
MKKTDLLRKDREMRRAQKREEVLLRRSEKKAGLSVGDYIDALSSRLFHDDNKIYNIKNNADILGLFERMKKDLPDKQWENVLRKAVKKTQVKEREKAFEELKVLLNT